MAAGSAGGAAPANPFAVPGSANDPPSFEEVTATMNRMVDSITILQTQMASLSEDHDVFLQRCPDSSTGESGPAVTELRYAHPQEYDRRRIRELEEKMEKRSSLAWMRTKTPSHSSWKNSQTTGTTWRP